MRFNPLKKVIVFGFGLVLLFSMLSCSLLNNESKEKIDDINRNESKQSCPLISSETAILIAKGILCLDYDLSDREIKVETETELWKDKGEMWKITFYRTKDRDIPGGDPIVWIFKNNGERFTVKHQK